MSASINQSHLQQELLLCGLAHATDNHILIQNVEMNHNDGLEASFDFYDLQGNAQFTVSAMCHDDFATTGWTIEVRIPMDPDERKWRVVYMATIPSLHDSQVQS